MGKLPVNQALVMPHEDLERKKAKVALLDRMVFLKTVFVELMRMRFSPYERKIDICQRLYNGQRCGTIHRKYDFIELIRKLGYRGPEQTLYTPGEASGLDNAIRLLEKHSTVLCKPKNGQQGIGIFVCSDSEELRVKLENVKEDYIIQEYIPPILDYRYVYHVDPEVTYRFCYKKLRPVLYGNGKDSVQKLIEFNNDLPPLSKKKLLKFLSTTELARVPKKDEKVDLVDSGNISKGACGVLVKGEELAALDRVLLPLIEDLQHRCNLELTTFCFDLGLLRKPSCPDDARKEDFIFYEYQIPFGLAGYITAPEVIDNKARVARMFMGSLQRSWIARNRACPT